MAGLQSLNHYFSGYLATVNITTASGSLGTGSLWTDAAEVILPTPTFGSVITPTLGVNGLSVHGDGPTSFGQLIVTTYDDGSPELVSSGEVDVAVNLTQENVSGSYKAHCISDKRAQLVRGQPMKRTLTFECHNLGFGGIGDTGLSGSF